MRRQFLWFAVSGALAFLLDAGIVQGLVSLLAVDPYSARLVSVACAMVFTWLFNRSITFAGIRPEGQGLITEFLRYVGTQTGGLIVNYTTYSIVLWLLPWTKTWPVVAVAAGSIAGLSVNFLAAKRLVFERGRRA
ncbi:GtrA family protein [Pseudomarimonas arenosa]|uniref:GtrA family protein n=1 Tax=Pseudomarimonas arenosa TaxID=2774145 RepID=A0AAW3ZGV6_9GAMM|nr:GtrA family protein [Pseudomarimonas arenosa]MBD8525348.1 GtrA family protein [Pseudomarimonas arenosa]